MNQTEIEKLLEPVKKRGGDISLFFGTVVGIKGSTLVVQPRTGGTVYATTYVYTEVGDLVSCLAQGTTIIAFAAKDAKRLEASLKEAGLLYSAGKGITISNYVVSADVDSADLQAVNTVANNALAAANKAQTSANTAQSTANTAKTNAATAQSTADTANTTANAAKSAASAAQSTADTAKSEAEAAQTTADGKADANHTHDYLPLSGGSMTGNIDIKDSGAKDIGVFVQNTDTGTRVRLQVGTGKTNHGVYSDTLKKWLLHGDADGNVYVGGININSFSRTTAAADVFKVGSVYLTYDTSFDPAKTFGGTWTKRTDTYLFMGITVWRCTAEPS